MRVKCWWHLSGIHTIAARSLAVSLTTWEYGIQNYISKHEFVFHCLPLNVTGAFCFFSVTPAYSDLFVFLFNATALCLLSSGIVFFSLAKRQGKWGRRLSCIVIFGKKRGYVLFFAFCAFPCAQVVRRFCKILIYCHSSLHFSMLFWEQVFFFLVWLGCFFFFFQNCFCCSVCASGRLEGTHLVRHISSEKHCPSKILQ